VGRFVLLIRGVNVGKGNRVPMAELRTALEELGYTSVRTILNSGNAVFDSASRSPAQLAADIALAIQARFGVVVPIIVKSAAEFGVIVGDNPIAPPESENSRFLVAFAMDPAKLQALEVLESLLLPGERLAITAHAAYLHCTAGLLESKAGEAILGKAGRGVTTRNWGTTLKLADLLSGSPGSASCSPNGGQ
jgi:uncharacterized protein (DUF1697 family)